MLHGKRRRKPILQLGLRRWRPGGHRSAIAGMDMTQEQFGAILRLHRTANKLRLDQVAGLVESTIEDVERMELGSRKVSVHEFEMLAKIYGVRKKAFFDPFKTGRASSGTLYRSIAGRADAASLRSAIESCFQIYYQLDDLKKFCGVTSPDAQAYNVAAPRDAAEAVRQGRRAAEAERDRMGLGIEPVADVFGLLEDQGVDVGLAEFPDDVSGAMLAKPDQSPMIFAKASEHVVRRSFSLAHEYAHVLFDRRATESSLSQVSEAEAITETRANAFAGFFLVPAGGVHAALSAAGKFRPGFMSSQRGAIEPGDVVDLAKRYAVSRQVVAIQLMRLGFVDAKARDSLLEAVPKRSRGADFDHVGARARFRTRYVSLATQAHASGEITSRKLLAALRLVVEEEEAARLAAASVSAGEGAP